MSCVCIRRGSGRLNASSSSSRSSTTSYGLLRVDRQRLHCCHYKRNRIQSGAQRQLQLWNQRCRYASLGSATSTAPAVNVADGFIPPSPLKPAFPATSSPSPFTSSLPPSSFRANLSSTSTSLGSSSSPSSISTSGSGGQATTPAPVIHTSGSMPGKSAAGGGRGGGGRAGASGALGASTVAPTTHLPIERFPSTQPPSHKRPEIRKTQLHRQYTALLRSSPIVLLFQHSNLTAVEWMAIRRELTVALQAVERAQQAHKNSNNAATKDKKGPGTDEKNEAIADTLAAIAASTPGGLSIANETRLQIVQTGILASALRVVEFYHPNETLHDLPEGDKSVIHPTDPLVESSAPVSTASGSPDDPSLTHALSRTAWKVAKENLRKQKEKMQLQREQEQLHAQEQALSLIKPLLSGPIALLSFPVISPPHIAAALSILAPEKTRFPAPRRRVRPSYHDPAVQAGVQKLMLLGARVDENLGLERGVGSMQGALGSAVGVDNSRRRVLDAEGVRDVASIKGGIDELRAQLVHVLESVGVSLVSGALEGAGRSIWGVLESRRMEMEKQEKQESGGDAAATTAATEPKKEG